MTIITASLPDINKLKLNPDKTEVLLVGGSGFREGELNLVLNGVALPLRDKVRSLGVLLDPELSLEAQVTAAARSTFFQLRLIHQLRPYLEYDCLATVTHALVTSRLDFCNALYVGLPLKTVRILQLVQNRAARLLTGTGHYVHMTPVLCQLHWLPIEVQAQFKVLVMTYKALNGLGPGYLKERLHPYMPARPLRSAGEALLQELSVKEIRRIEKKRQGVSRSHRMADKKRLAFSIIQFLQDQLQNGGLSPDAQESLEGFAIQCLETAFGVSLEDKGLGMSHTLPEIFEAAVAKEPLQSTQSTPTAEPVLPSEEDAAEAERLKAEGNEQMKVENFESAVLYYGKAIELNPSNAVYYCNRQVPHAASCLAAAYSKLGNYAGAVRDCERAIHIDPKYSKAYGRMGLALSSLNKFSDAVIYYRKALELDPDNETYKSNLKVTEQKMKEAPSPTGGAGGFDLAGLLNNPSFMSMVSGGWHVGWTELCFCRLKGEHRNRNRASQKGSPRPSSLTPGTSRLCSRHAHHGHVQPVFEHTNRWGLNHLSQPCPNPSGSALVYPKTAQFLHQDIMGHCIKGLAEIQVNHIHCIPSIQPPRNLVIEFHKASNLMNNPQVQQLMSGMISGSHSPVAAPGAGSSPSDLASLIQAGQQFAQQMQQQNPELIEQLRSQIRSRTPSNSHEEQQE
ncbi:Small glutamine-rich tetratricopeptide repeat-containing protein alpha [Varanus komodoensis]|nr:Small glutamine-rich tetratricopeptide repeat-containing protein alpha [Varanus komodoensis]